MHRRLTDDGKTYREEADAAMTAGCLWPPAIGALYALLYAAARYVFGQV